jgi:hypothetical protein
MLKTKESENMLLDYKQFKLFIVRLSTIIFSFSLNSAERLGMLLEVIKKRCKKHYKVDICSNLIKLDENKTKNSNYKNIYLYSSLSKYPSKTLIKDSYCENSKSQHKRTFSQPELQIASYGSKIKLLNSSNRKNTPLANLSSYKKNSSQENLEIISSDSNYAVKPTKIHQISKKFEKFKASTMSIFKNTKKYSRKVKQQNEFIIKNRNKLFNSMIVLRLIFISWKNYVINKNLTR